MTYSTSTTRLWDSDVLVVGSGSAGAIAAITAAQQGARVTLVERYGFMGGTSTQVLDTFYGFYTPGSEARKVVGGVPDQVINALFARDRAILRPNTYGAGQGITYDPQALKILWETLATQAGIRLLYHTFVVDVLMAQERIRGVVAVNKGGFFELPAQIFIDASGDADVAVAAGVPYEGAEHGAVQSLTTTFSMINVDTDRARSVKKAQLHELMGEAIGQGYTLPRKEGSIHITPFDGVMVTNMTRVGAVNAIDAVALTEAEIEGRRQAEEYARFLIDKVPGYEKAIMGQLSHQIGVRESRRIYGCYRLTRNDVLTARDFEDAIARCGAPIEDHHAGSDTKWLYLPDGATYGIPYRCLLPETVEGLLVVGRCFSAEHDAHASARSMGQCMAMGQAAGMAAVIASHKQIMPHEVNSQMLRDRLIKIGAVV